jgi:hypothetical protein
MSKKRKKTRGNPAKGITPKRPEDIETIEEFNEQLLVMAEQSLVAMARELEEAGAPRELVRKFERCVMAREAAEALNLPDLVFIQGLEENKSPQLIFFEYLMHGLVDPSDPEDVKDFTEGLGDVFGPVLDQIVPQDEEEGR